jgi:Cytochrome P460
MKRRSWQRALPVWSSWCLAAACGEAPTPDFPADYADTFLEVRGCRSSGDHELHRIKVLADPAAAAIYTSRNGRFPEAAVVLKEEYDFADTACRGPILEWTVMRRLAGDDRGGWAWQRVSAERDVKSQDEPRCIGCHQRCGLPPEGHDGTCAVSGL